MSFSPPGMSDQQAIPETDRFITATSSFGSEPSDFANLKSLFLI